MFDQGDEGLAGGGADFVRVLVDAGLGCAVVEPEGGEREVARYGETQPREQTAERREIGEDRVGPVPAEPGVESPEIFGGRTGFQEKRRKGIVALAPGTQGAGLKKTAEETGLAG